jgi:phosphatidylglycerophosphatase A
MRNLQLMLASFFGAGYFPVASGTLASALAMLPFFWLRPHPWAYLLAVVIGFALGVWTSTAAEKILKEKDSHKIVIDEVVGYLIAAAFLPHFWFYPLAAFFLFRLFDVWKPGWIRYSQMLPGGYGVMVDDVLAGLLANLCLQVVRLIF